MEIIQHLKLVLSHEGKAENSKDCYVNNPDELPHGSNCIMSILDHIRPPSGKYGSNEAVNRWATGGILLKIQFQYWQNLLGWCAVVTSIQQAVFTSHPTKSTTLVTMHVSIP